MQRDRSCGGVHSVTTLAPLYSELPEDDEDVLLVDASPVSVMFFWISFGLLMQMMLTPVLKITPPGAMS